MPVRRSLIDGAIAAAVYGFATVTNRELIEAALDSLHPLRRDDGVKLGNVSAAVASRSGRIYQGVNLFTHAGAAQICAEKDGLRCDGHGRPVRGCQGRRCLAP
jgi:hypothetical protein